MSSLLAFPHQEADVANMTIRTAFPNFSLTFGLQIGHRVPGNPGTSSTKSMLARSFVSLLLLAVAGPAFALSVNTWPSADAPTPLGTEIIWDANTQDAAGQVLYRYRVRGPSQASFRTVRDFSPVAVLRWTPVETDGTYQIEATALDRATGETASTVFNYPVSPLAQNEPVITPTAHELVFLFSAPPCAEGARTRVMMQSPEGLRRFTNWTACAEGRTFNVYLAGMRASTEYHIRQVTDLPDGTTILSPPMNVTTGELRLSPSPTTVVLPANGATDVLVQSKVSEFPSAVDMEGNVIWYTEVPVRYLTRPVEGGYFLALNEDPNADEFTQTLRLIDLAGNIVFETSAGAVNVQLERMGQHPITGFHHEAAMLENGRILALAGTERILNNVQGEGDVDVLGDTILVLNSDLQVEWVWDSFDHLNPARAAVMGETCKLGTGGCPVFRLAPVANDWLHGNSLQLAPDGNIIYSARHQDWVIKIDYNNGQGSGDVIWRMGKDGDFQILSDDPWPWFSHQHDANFVNTGTMAVFDNGNTRAWDLGDIESRGQVLKVDEAQRTVTALINTNLGAYSRALGTAQLLDNGHYHFDLGWTPDNTSQAVEVDAAGKVVSRLQTSTTQYRIFRMKDLYSQ